MPAVPKTNNSSYRTLTKPSRLAAFRNFGLGLHPAYPRFQPGVGFMAGHPMLGLQGLPRGPLLEGLPRGPLPHHPFLASSLPLLGSKPEPPAFSSPGSSPLLGLPKHPFSLVRPGGSPPCSLPSSLLLPSSTGSVGLCGQRVLGK